MTAEAARTHKQMPEAVIAQLARVEQGGSRLSADRERVSDAARRAVRSPTVLVLGAIAGFLLTARGGAVASCPGPEKETARQPLINAGKAIAGMMIVEGIHRLISRYIDVAVSSLGDETEKQDSSP
jgi:hypothetical protein